MAMTKHVWPFFRLPQRYREAQADFFGKKGLPWHCTWIVRKTEAAAQERFEQLGFVHVFDTAVQDA